MTLTRPLRSIQRKILTPRARMHLRHHPPLRPWGRLQTSLHPLLSVAVLRRLRRPRRPHQPRRPRHSCSTRPTTLSQHRRHSHPTTPRRPRPARLPLCPQGLRRLFPPQGPCHLRRLCSQAEPPTMPGKACRARRARRGVSRSTRPMLLRHPAMSQARLRTFTDRALLTRRNRSSGQGSIVVKAGCILSAARVFTGRVVVLQYPPPSRR